MKTQDSTDLVVASILFGAFAATIIMAVALKSSSSPKEKKAKPVPKKEKTIEDLEAELQEYVNDQEYEKAAQQRDLINSKKQQLINQNK